MTTQVMHIGATDMLLNTDGAAFKGGLSCDVGAIAKDTCLMQKATSINAAYRRPSIHKPQECCQTTSDDTAQTVINWPWHSTEACRVVPGVHLSLPGPLGE